MRGVTAHLHHCTDMPEVPTEAERLATPGRATVKGTP